MLRSSKTFNKSYELLQATKKLSSTRHEQGSQLEAEKIFCGGGPNKI
jgi:hypothetical protein